MVYLGLEPGAAGWKTQTNPLSYGGTPFNSFYSNMTVIHIPNQTKKKELFLHKLMENPENTHYRLISRLTGFGSFGAYLKRAPYFLVWQNPIIQKIWRPVANLIKLRS